MDLNQILPLVGACLFLAITLAIALGRVPGPRSIWIGPAVLAGLFLIFSAWAVIAEGPLGFVPEHTRNLWGNQITFDLLIGVGIGWLLIVPRAKAVGMRPVPWLAFVAATGSIGFLAMASRLLFLESRKGTGYN